MTDPVAGFRDVAVRHPRCFWLDGGGARAWSGRRSILGWLEDDDVSLTYDAARCEVRRHTAAGSVVVGDDVFAALDSELAAGGPRDQWFGYLGYACRPDLAARPDPHLPDAVWMRPSHVRLFEHAPEPDSPVGGGPPTFEVPGNVAPSPPGRRVTTDTSGGGGRATFGIPTDVAPPPLGEVAGPPADYIAAFAEVQEALHAGDTYEANLTYRLAVAADLDPPAAYLRLRDLNPAPYAGFLQHDLPGHRAWLLSSSPERYALVTGDRVLETRPIKGTTPRGTTPAEDAAQRERLAADPKTRAENLMILDLLRHDLAQVCDVGSVEVPELMTVESYPSVHQLVSTVRGRLRTDVGTVAALQALFPAGSMTGAPKRRTMELVDRVEATPRGAYAGAFGWVSGDGRADLGVVIRSLTTAGEGQWWLGTGGGITVRSTAAEEWAESRWKAERLLRVFG